MDEILVSANAFDFQCILISVAESRYYSLLGDSVKLCIKSIILATSYMTISERGLNKDEKGELWVFSRLEFLYLFLWLLVA